MTKKEKPSWAMIRIPLEWILGKGTKRHKDKSKYNRKPKYKKPLDKDS